MSSDKQVPAPAPPTKDQQKPRKPPLSDWPTIKIVRPPQGRFSPKKDEWCFSVCSQSVAGRAHTKEPRCRSICLRRVFAHEVKNVLSHKPHKNLGPDGKAKYPLPAEGQPANLPRILGGTVTEGDEGETETRTAVPSKFWDEGWYLWTGKTRRALHEKTSMMACNLETQQKVFSMKGSPRAIRSKPIDFSPPQDALLVPLRPDITPLLTSVRNLLAPSVQVLGMLRESIVSGEQKEFVQRVWEKAKTDEPFILAQRTLSFTYDTWKKRGAVEDDGKKGST